MIKQTISALISCLIITSIAYGEPSINSTSGTCSHNSAITITGANFGSKPLATPVVWDTCETGTPADKWDVVRPASGDLLGDHGKIGAYRTKATIDGWGSPYSGGESTPHARSTKYYCANAYAATDAGGSIDQDECSLGINTGGATYAYFIFYYRVDSDWCFCGHGTDGNHKMLSVGEGTTPYGGAHFYWEFRHPRVDNATETGFRESATCGCLNASSNDITPFDNPRTIGWIHIEYLMHFHASGFAKAVADNVTSMEMTSCNPSTWGAINYCGIGGYHRNYGNNDGSDTARNFRYFDDIYFDTTFARVMLANNQNYENATIIEPQIPSAWSDSSITVSVNQGALDSCKTYYLFVFDSNNIHNTVGHPIRIVSGDSEPPCPPTGLKVQQ
jgi:hypothetical protein